MSELKQSQLISAPRLFETTGIKKLTIDMSQWRLLND
jgi:hypothetical protein